MRVTLRWAGPVLLLCALAVAPATAAHAAAERVPNPYAGARVYVDPDFSAQVRAQAAATGGAAGAAMARVARYPTAVWLDSIAAVGGLTRHLDAALAQQRRSRGAPTVVQLVLYDVPARDCRGAAAPGELGVDPADQQRYRSEFVDPIVRTLAEPRYAGLRIVTIIEPGALPDVAFSQPYQPLCTIGAVPHRDAFRYALARLGTRPNVYNYLEFASAASFGYESNLVGAVSLYADLVGGAGGPGFATVAGFATNVRQYVPLAEPFIPSAETLVGGMPVYLSKFYDWTDHVAELAFAQAARTALVTAGFAPEVGMLIDTARNGWGGPARPTAASTVTTVDSFVNASRVDRRPNRWSWCNQVGAGLGERPRPAPAAGIHAYAWLTPPGVSDGVAAAGAPPDPDRPYLTHRQPCDPVWADPRGGYVPTNALAGAPHAGRWFPQFFAQLVANAYPPIR